MSENKAVQVGDAPTSGEGHTRVPNFFLDRWMPTLSPSEIVLYLFIFRRVANTDGGRRAGGFPISLAQFCADASKAETELDHGTGIARSSVKRGLKALMTRGLIGRKKGTGTTADFYSLLAISKIPTERSPRKGRGGDASGSKKNTVAAPTTGSTKNTERVQKEPASGSKLDTVSLLKRTIKITTEKKQPEAPASVAVSRRSLEIPFFDLLPLFEGWFDGEWAPTFGTHDRTQAAEAFRVFATTANMADLIACTRSYVANRDPGSTLYAMHPQTFLRRYGPNQFRDRWPAFRKVAPDNADTRTQKRRDSLNQGLKMMRKMGL